MGFIAWVKTLFEPNVNDAPHHRPAALPTGRRSTRNVSLTGRMLFISQPSFVGLAHQSPNKRWILGRRDSDGVSRGGHRELGNGQVVLADLERDAVLLDLRNFARPVNAAVADSGRFVLNDGGFGSALQACVVAIDANGRQRQSRYYSANIFNQAISKCGRYAAVQTCNSSTDDSNLLEVLDLENARTVFSLQPATGWAEDYVFDVDDAGQLKSVGVLHRCLGRFNYSATGVFLDSSAFQEAQLAKGDYSVKVMAAAELIKADPTPSGARMAIEAADAALAAGAKDRYDWGATAHRVRAESFEILGELHQALEAYDKALVLNPRSASNVARRHCASNWARREGEWRELAGERAGGKEGLAGQGSTVPRGLGSAAFSNS